MAYPSETSDPHKEIKYRKAAATREMLLRAGSELLQERGLAPGLTRVTLNDAIERSGIPRSSAYRMFAGGDGPLESFRDALLESLISEHLEVGFDSTSVEEVIAQHSDQLNSDDPEVLAQALRDVIRLGVDAALNETLDSLGFFVLASTTVALGSPLTHQFGPMDSLPDHDLVAEAESRLIQAILPLCKVVAQMAGIRARTDGSPPVLVQIATTAVQSLALRRSIDPRLMTVDRPTGPNGEIQRWSAAAILVEGLVIAYTEPDPKRRVSADLSLW